VHGGPELFEPVRIDETVMRQIQDESLLDPTHNAGGLGCIEAARSMLPGTPNIAVFDTSFHHHMPEVAARYAIPTTLFGGRTLRRYGFHGISYRYVSSRLAELIPPVGGAGRLILCHLGNGASVCAVRDGVSIDTSMGFTPLEGLVMGTRCGDLDPGLLLYLIIAGGESPDRLEEILNRKSGLLALSGRSVDVRDLEAAAGQGDADSELALASFAYRVRKYIGAYAAALGGVDALAFAGGIGEHSASVRARICAGLGFLGLEIDAAANVAASGKRPEAIGAPQRERVWIVPTDEELQIARETMTLLRSSPTPSP
jgi:acetate kinase